MSTTAFHGQKIRHMIKSILIQKKWRDLYKFELLCTFVCSTIPFSHIKLRRETHVILVHGNTVVEI